MSLSSLSSLRGRRLKGKGKGVLLKTPATQATLLAVQLIVCAASDKFRDFYQPNSICKQNNACFAQSHLIKSIELLFKKRGSLKKRL